MLYCFWCCRKLCIFLKPRIVKSCLSDAKCFSGSRYSFRVQELKPLLFHNWPVHGEIAWLFPAPC
ncbi:hypothetical protein AWP72_03710 [Escherichia coli]|nr:hypothetical protein [Escherichia coli]OKW22088.1 hypothetical protein AWP72_03710 [Escherichia coli]RCA59748.1 hypothetical protein C6A39_24845 [Escherichia coli]